MGCSWVPERLALGEVVKLWFWGLLGSLVPNWGFAPQRVDCPWVGFADLEGNGIRNDMGEDDNGGNSLLQFFGVSGFCTFQRYWKFSNSTWMGASQWFNPWSDAIITVPFQDRTFTKIKLEWFISSSQLKWRLFLSHTFTGCATSCILSDLFPGWQAARVYCSHSTATILQRRILITSPHINPFFRYFRAPCLGPNVSSSCVVT